MDTVKAGPKDVYKMCFNSPNYEVVETPLEEYERLLEIARRCHQKTTDFFEGRSDGERDRIQVIAKKVFAKIKAKEKLNKKRPLIERLRSELREKGKRFLEKLKRVA